MSEAHPPFQGGDSFGISGCGDPNEAAIESVPRRTMQRREKSTLYYSSAASLALHLALITALIVKSSPVPEKNAPFIVIEVQGLVADKQVDEKQQQETRGQEEQETAKPTPSEAVPPDEPKIDGAPGDTVGLPEPPPPKRVPPKSEMPRPVARLNSAGVSAQSIPGNDAPQKAQTIVSEKALIAIYVNLLAKKIQTNLVYPEEARHARLEGKATVSFTILTDGEIQPDSLTISASSRQPVLDDSALRTVRASVPFDPPPKEITVSVGVTFGPEH